MNDLETYHTWQFLTSMESQHSPNDLFFQNLILINYDEEPCYVETVKGQNPGGWLKDIKDKV